MQATSSMANVGEFRYSLGVHKDRRSCHPLRQVLVLLRRTISAAAVKKLSRSLAVLLLGQMGWRAAYAQVPDLRIPQTAAKYFGADAPWFVRNIPFLDIDDPDIEAVYFYRWKLYRSHIREIGAQGTTVLEFLPDVPWAREPYTDLNDSSSFHLFEGRWLRDPAVVNSLIDHMYRGKGNTRAFSESIAAASEAATLVSGDPDVLLRNLDGMRTIFDAWDDHFDRKRNLYWIEPLADATEYTISSIDASGAGFQEHPSSKQNENGFTQGYAFRPSINTYQFGNALAISRIAERAGLKSVAAEYAARAGKIRQATLAQLWNSELDHFTDRYQRSTAYVKQGDFIRGRELVGYLPWFYELTPKAGADASRYASAWKHAISTDELLGGYGLRTVEPTYARYMVQYRYAGSQPECQWNGPSWPFQTSQLLTGLANLLDDYPAQNVIGKADYLHLLRMYTRQHFLTPGRLDLQEDYDPDKGGPIVGLERSHHYAHSTYVDLVLSGLVGIRPRADDILEIAPLLPQKEQGDEAEIKYFAVEGLVYHGHDIAVLYDAAGSRYHLGKGLIVFVDGRRVSGPAPLQRTLIQLRGTPPHRPARGAGMPEDIAVNVGIPDGPAASASSSSSAKGAQQANDGRLWFFPENVNGWSPSPEATASESWWAVHLQNPRRIGSVELYFFGDDSRYFAPSSFKLQYLLGNDWVDVPIERKAAGRLLANGTNQIDFVPLTTSGLRLLLPGSPQGHTIRLVEFEAFETPRPF